MIRSIMILFFLFIFLNLHQSSKGDQQIANCNFKKEFDSTGIRVIYEKKDLRTLHRFIINIYINKSLYKSDVFPNNEFIYIPDTLKPNDKIKITVNPIKWASRKAKSKVYKFKYNESEKIIMKIKY